MKPERQRTKLPDGQMKVASDLTKPYPLLTEGRDGLAKDRRRLPRKGSRLVTFASLGELDVEVPILPLRDEAQIEEAMTKGRD